MSHFIVIAFYGTFGATLLIIYSTLMCRSETYIDKMQKQTMVVENSTYNLGCRQNFLQVFGDKWCLWPVPVFTSPGTGCTFPMRTLNASSSNA
ncbi:hypothetical protein NQ315_007683 [Exocentrus adspersus]|uniref:Uncharacterized protein n=1 Tax=Exocentrus adspersus TaxID=1586481 RepID=A0AAV8W7V4_9CUCU|nr:hypothetical protein NQ315_007683 [Exocentrus adspersus]